MKHRIVLSLLLALVSCTGGTTGGQRSTLEISNITGNGTSGRIQDGVIIRGTNFSEDAVVRLLTRSGTLVSILAVREASAQEIEAVLPSEVVPGEYTIQLQAGAQTAAEDIFILQGEPGPKGDSGDTGPQGSKGDTGNIGPQGPKGDTGDMGLQGPQGDPGQDAAGSLHLLDSNAEDIGPVLDVIKEGRDDPVVVTLWINGVGTFGGKARIDLNEGTIVDERNLVFESVDCTGTPYFAAAPNIIFDRIYVGGNGALYIADTSYSDKNVGSTLDTTNSCSTVGAGLSTVYGIDPVTIADYPFSAPMSLDVR